MKTVGQTIIVGKWECIVTKVTAMGYEYQLIRKVDDSRGKERKKEQTR